MTWPKKRLSHLIRLSALLFMLGPNHLMRLASTNGTSEKLSINSSPPLLIGNIRTTVPPRMLSVNARYQTDSHYVVLLFFSCIVLHAI